MITTSQAIITHMTTSMLRSCDFDFQGTSTLVLEDGSVLALEKILRIVPRKRLVALAEYKQEKVIAKIFFSKKNAEFHAAREKLGADNLKKMKIPSPELINQLSNQEKTAQILFFRYLHDADNLHTLWEETHSLDILYPILKQVTQEIATQHVLGVMQKDMHFKNFMITTHKVFTLDGAQLDVFPHKLNKATSMKHLALFLSQMGVGFEAIQKELFLFYIKLRGWLVKPQDIDELFFLIREANRSRWARHQKKIFRESSQFTMIQSPHFKGVCNREKLPKDMRQLLSNPEQFFHDMPHTILKAGRSSTVIKVSVQGYSFVIKRYNIKHLFHRLKRAFTVSRARKSWYHAHKLILFGINVPTPIAFIEKNQGGMNTESYYISDFIDGNSLAELITNTTRLDQSLIINITKLLKKLALIEWTHGDLKATNILIVNNQPVLVDFDGAKEHLSLSGLRKNTADDWQRFLKNFIAIPALQEAFRNELIDNKKFKINNHYF